MRREAAIDRRFSLGQIRDIPEASALVAPVNVPEITFDTGSAAITPDQAQQLATLGKVIRDSIARNPDEIYMIEGYTDAIGSNAANLAAVGPARGIGRAGADRIFPGNARKTWSFRVTANSSC